MKKFMQHLAIPALVFISVFIYTSCDEPDDFFITNPSEIAQPGGSAVSLANGNVSLFIPQGAVNTNIKITARICNSSEDCNFLLKMIKIEPAVRFEKPVTVLFKYDGELLNSQVSPEGCPLTVCYWNSEEDYASRLKHQCISCCVDSTANAIKFCIEQTGLFAVAINTNGEFN